MPKRTTQTQTPIFTPTLAPAPLLPAPTTQRGQYPLSPSYVKPTMIGPLQLRGGRMLGPMGQMASELIVEISLDPIALVQFQAMANRRMKPFTEMDIYRLIHDRFYSLLKTQLLVLINSIVPRDSGRLRNAMELSIAGGHGSNAGSTTSNTSNLHPFFVVINTGAVPYAKVVENMPDDWLKHPGSHGLTFSQRFGRTVKRAPGQVAHTLYDPDAEQHWFQKTLTRGRNIAAQLYTNEVFNSPTLFKILEGVYEEMNGLGQGPKPNIIIPSTSIQYIISLLLTVRFG